MAENLHLLLLFFCGILCQGIFAVLSDEDNRVSSDLLVRKRRVINHLPGQVTATRIQDANYIVKIKHDGRTICAGAILSQHTVITAAPCIQRQLTSYKITSGGAYDHRSNAHNIISNLAYFGNPPNHNYEGISLLTVDPPFVYTGKTGNIRLHVGLLSTGTMVTVFGWGYFYPPQPGWEVRQVLHSITLPIMNHGQCQNDYRNNHFAITEKHICTYDPQQYCARGDTGSPLVFNNKLVGIHVWKGECRTERNPDVFINLQRADYSEWIRDHTI